MVRYSPYAARALAYLKKNSNDVDIFVEDTSNPNMWLEIIRKCLPSNLKIRSVNTLGGRQQVIAACKLDQKNTGRRKLYIIDGDFDHALAIKKPRLKYLYRLRSYCIENTLISRKSISDIGLVCKPNKTEEDILKLCDFDNWHYKVYDAFSPLFIIYATVKKLSNHLQTVGFPVKNLFKNDIGGIQICKKKISTRARNISRQSIAHIGWGNFKKSLREIKLRCLNINSSLFVSGKDYIMPSLVLQIQKTLGFWGQIEQLKSLLAKSWQKENEPWLFRRLKNIAA